MNTINYYYKIVNFVYIEILKFIIIINFQLIL